MVTWLVKPEYKKSIVERQYWRKDNNVFIVDTTWRWGEFHVYTDDDTPPELEEGVDILDCGYESEMIETSDGCSEDYSMLLCDDETSEWLEEFLEDNSVFDLEEHGWSSDDCAMLIQCDLIIEKVDE